MSRSLASLLLALAALVLVACSDGGDDEGPQIGVHQWPVAFGNFPPASAGEDGDPGTADDVPAPPLQPFDLIVMNLGGGTLQITAVEVRGDVNCSIQEGPEFDDLHPLPVSLTRTDQAFLRWTYLPGGTRNGEQGGDVTDQISIALTSNSSESPLYEVSSCGRIVAPGVDAATAPREFCDLTEVQGSCL